MKKSVLINQHNVEIQKNLRSWENKPVLRKIYHDYYKLIANHLLLHENGTIAEIGSGIGNIKEVIPNCLRTDIFENNNIDQVEDAYKLSFANNSISNLILFDVFHHLEYPGNALDEFHRVLISGGRIIIFDPCISALGLLVYGLLHHEPLGLTKKIHWNAPKEWDSSKAAYYAAQANAFRIFLRNTNYLETQKWAIRTVRRYSAVSYVASGGYSKPQLYPVCFLPFLKCIDSLADLFPSFFATRILVVIEKS
jgi:SAM-dependent methyltransferase